MDAFKLLTRSTKLKTGQVSRPAISNSLPSAGAAANPQLFSGRHEPDAAEAYNEQNGRKGGKRKRGSDGNELSADASAITLDFFGSGSSAHDFSNGQAKTGTQNQNEDDGKKTSASDEIAISESPLSIEERKAVLTAHKIKVTDLRTPLVIAEDDKKSGKNKKKQKGEKAPIFLSRKQQRKSQRMYPRPLMSFQQLRTRYRISRRLSENILNQGYAVPTEVQLGALPLLLGDCQSSSARSQKDGFQLSQSTLEPDLLVVAPTGSGKTLAFMIPLINKIICHHHLGESQSRELFAVILAPTKELVSQIVNEGRKLMVGTGVKITAVRKGMRVVEDMEMEEAFLDEESGISEDEDDEAAKAKRLGGKVPVTKSDILVSTPLLLANSLSGNKSRSIAPLPTIQSLVLDEADVLLDSLFRDQTLEVWRACTNARLRVGLWSATMGSSIEELAKSTINERRRSLGLRDESFLVRLVVGLKDTAIPNISHKLVYAATEQGKLLGLRQLLNPKGASSTSDTHLRAPFLVFTQTISRAVALHSELKYDIPAEAGGASRIAVLHSELSDSQRSDIMAGFRKGEIWILITTDLLSRGVDFRGINGVVNYDIPNSSATYVHRVGRTGRAGREGGVAVTFYTKEDIPYVKNIANVIAASEKLRGVSEDKGIQEWLLNALPNLSKKDKKDLKQHGVRLRRPMTKKGAQDEKARSQTRISTKSGFERRKEHNRRDAAKASRRRMHAGQAEDGGNSSDNGSWDGIEE
ncbi:ATP-dependent RNA helicase ROK1 [Histoplasma capsulatum var. duboisii H88]|uniref:ATP-dependent RNA helicase n=1 Tax=Ajellomyces capsulatus (strain H88) TaxID=544711 RepID=F0UF76_AJEC8|nr:ATP-dependent RNA helicase ROK1 [Histoplasma capsulatum var. duboisii H88]QSS54877.1 ATP-dependent RNA helicase ROK1 [Histoplasma capsulatum var. duboisii H88]